MAFFKSQTKNLFNVIFFYHQQPKVYFEREQKWLKILEPYFNEFSLSSANIQNGSDRGIFREITDEILGDFHHSGVVKMLATAKVSLSPN